MNRTAVENELMRLMAATADWQREVRRAFNRPVPVPDEELKQLLDRYPKPPA